MIDMLMHWKRCVTIVCLVCRLILGQLGFRGCFFCSRTSHSRCLRPHPRLDSLPRIGHSPAHQVYCKFGLWYPPSCNATSAEIPGTYLHAIFYIFVEKLETGHVPIRVTDFPTFLYTQNSVDIIRRIPTALCKCSSAS